MVARPTSRDRARRPDRHRAIVVCAPGLEEIVGGEVDDLGIAHRPAGTGALSARMTDRQLYLANAGLGCATRVLVDAGSFTARSFAVLEKGIADLDLGAWLAPDVPVRFRVSSRRSKLVHTGAIEERLRRVLRVADPESASPRGGRRDRDDPDESPDGPAQLIVVRVERDVVSLRVDSSGAPLYQRGWRGPQAKAPLRETVARAALVAAGWRPGIPLVDPFAGSGTIAIEAARWAAGIAPGADRGFAFADWPSFAPGTWASVHAGLAAAESDAAPAGAPILARDRDAGAVAAATENAERAGVADRVAVAAGPVSELEPPAGCDRPGLIVTNPPWGARIQGGGDLRDLYAALGRVARDRFPGWGVAVLTGDDQLAGATGLRPRTVGFRARAGAHPIGLHVWRPRH